VKGKNALDAGSEVLTGGLGAFAKKFIAGAFNDEIAKKADEIMANFNSRGVHTSSEEILKKELGKVVDQHDGASDLLTNWSSKYSLEYVKRDELN